MLTDMLRYTIVPPSSLSLLQHSPQPLRQARMIAPVVRAAKVTASICLMAVPMRRMCLPVIRIKTLRMVILVLCPRRARRRKAK
jgi:hypothetical protein